MRVFWIALALLVFCGTHRAEADDVRTILTQRLQGYYDAMRAGDFDKALGQIDNASSDYYVLGYYSKNPDPLRRRRRVDVKVMRQGMTVYARKEYSLKPLPTSAPTKQ